MEKKYPESESYMRGFEKNMNMRTKYQIVVPEKVDDILYEAKLMHHCVNNTKPIMNRMSQRDPISYFKRKAEQPAGVLYA